MLTAQLTEREQLENWCKEKKLFNYIHVQDWQKSPHYYLRAERTIRDFVSEGKLRRIPDAEAVLTGLRQKGHAALAWFQWIG